MDLVVNKVVQLKVVHISDRNTVLKGFTAAAVVKHGLSVLVFVCLAEFFTDNGVGVRKFNQLQHIARSHFHKILHGLVGLV